MNSPARRPSRALRTGTDAATKRKETEKRMEFNQRLVSGSIKWMLPLFIAVFGVFPLLWLGTFEGRRLLLGLVSERPLLAFGLPACILVALALVLVLEQTRGPISFAIAGVRFRGAAGPITLFNFTVLTLVLCVRLLA